MIFRSVLSVALLYLAAVPAAMAGPSSELDWTAWQGLPVFEGGRMKPLDSFAREAVLEICGRESPRLSLAALPDADLSSREYAAASKLFPEGKPRKFAPAELVLSWMLQPAAWERVPFLLAEYHELRKDILGLPVTNEAGRGLRYISPYQFDQSKGMRKWREEIGRRMAEAEAAGEEFQFKGKDKKAAELVQAYNRWRQLTFTPASLAHPSSLFIRNLVDVKRTWESMQESLDRFRQEGAAAGPSKLIGQVETSLTGLLELAHDSRMPQEKVERLATDLRFSANDLAVWFRRQNEKLAKGPPEMEAGRGRQLMAWMNALASRTTDLARQTTDLHLSIFDNGGALRIVPAMNPHALEENRTPEANPQSWLSLTALLLGSKSSLRQYPADDVDKVKRAFAKVASAYLDRDAEDRAERFDTATVRLAAAVRELGEAVGSAREQLPIRQLDDDVLEQTAYPAPGFTAFELHYNRFQPFLWSWILALVSVVLFSLSFGVMRRPMFWGGLAALVGTQAMIVYGFRLRTIITGWAPVTNMFETVVFVALVVGGLGLWFAVVPLVWGGIKEAWRLCSMPLTWESRRPETSSEEEPVFRRETQQLAGWVLAVPRILLMVLVFYAMTQVSYGEGEGYVAISLLPQIDAGTAMPTANDLVTWLVGLCVLVPAVWYVPRVVVTALLSLVTIPWTLAARGAKKPVEQVFQRKSYAFAGAAVALVASLLAFYAPVFDKDIGTLRPVLRDNFWLTVHVLTITAAYGAGLLAWGLGNVALFHYLFGRYRTPATPSAETQAKGHRPADNYVAPPEAHHLREPVPCASLAVFTYRATQVTVLLLAVGTITGALWADVAWGRFWGWDPKEVWALVSLLVYMVILHGRYAGMFGNFALAAFSVAGATSILMAWYGVNFVLGTGLHSYGEGSGGLKTVLVCVALNWVFLAAAGVRYYMETGTVPEDSDGTQQPEPPPSQGAEVRAEEEAVAET